MCRPRGLGGSPRAHSRRLDPPSGYLSWLPKPPLVSLATVERRASTMLLLPNHWGPQRQGGLDNSWEAGCQARFSLLPEKWNYTSLWSPFIFFLWFFFFFACGKYQTSRPGKWRVVLANEKGQRRGTTLLSVVNFSTTTTPHLLSRRGYKKTAQISEGSCPGFSLIGKLAQRPCSTSFSFPLSE